MKRAPHKKAEFQSRTEVSDGAGNYVSAWGPTQFTRWCGIHYLRGSESVMASRLTGKRPVILTVRSDEQTASITPDMRCLIDGEAFNIREKPRPTEDRVWLEFLAESGVADG
ncbi:phage head closure protein [Ponticaulis profundi]|uniref:Phage head closure protein n=1 Tax=Ponticaulis profundi TaxID=2665222 RepID=A0ABW1S8D0_9PROT